MRISLSIVVNLLVAIGILFGFLFSSAKVQGHRSNLPFEHVRAEALMVDPTLLQIVSGEFKGLMADYLNLKAAIFKGGSHKVGEDDWVVLYTLFKQSMELDPLFFHTGYYTQGILAWRKGWHRQAIEILTLHADNRHWDWEPKFYLGFDYFYHLRDNKMGAHYLMESSKLPNAPSITANLAARLIQRQGQTITAIAFLKSMLERAEDEELKENLAKRLKVHLGILKLEQARDAYLLREGQLPTTLDILVKNGYIPEIPETDLVEGFIYDPQTGEIRMESNQ